MAPLCLCPSTHPKVVFKFLVDALILSVRSIAVMTEWDHHQYVHRAPPQGLARCHTLCAPIRTTVTCSFILLMNAVTSSGPSSAAGAMAVGVNGAAATRHTAVLDLDPFKMQKRAVARALGARRMAWEAPRREQAMD
jgi:hypothetical protein